MFTERKNYKPTSEWSFVQCHFANPQSSFKTRRFRKKGRFAELWKNEEVNVAGTKGTVEVNVASIVKGAGGNPEVKHMKVALKRTGVMTLGIHVCTLERQHGVVVRSSFWETPLGQVSLVGGLGPVAV